MHAMKSGQQDHEQTYSVRAQGIWMPNRSIQGRSWKMKNPAMMEITAENPRN
jgi:hypothetical protein